MKQVPELLAPAGSFDSVRAAVRTGADAVYLGTKAFNARRNADNFDDAALRDAIRLCRLHGVKVHITLNTLVSDAELPKAKAVIRHVCALPDLARHASTQMSVQTAAGIALLKDLGYSRAVLPRELSRNEIAAIRESTDLELELFIHGAQCMCVSGQCLMSAMLGSRSGNRGLCAQPCRLPFSADNTERYDLSLKDLSLMDRLPALAALGVDSFKIEGRMKRAEYVAAAVTNARRALEGSRDAATADALRAVFSRQGFTSGYFDNDRGSHMFGVRTKEDVTAASGKVLSALQHLYEKERADVPVDFHLTVRQNGSLYEMDFPTCELKEIPVTDAMERAFGVRPVKAVLGMDLVCVFASEDQVREMRPDQERLKGLEGRIQNATAAGKETDCVSRSFCPKLAIPEDPVCGSAHCQIADYWSRVLGKKKLTACQASKRGGYLRCEMKENGRIAISGEAALVAVSEIMVEL